jgi:hypothetical protein
LGNGGLVFVKIPKLWYTLDVEVQAYLFMEKPLSGPSDPSDSRILLFLPPQRHADALLKSPIHFAFEEAWYIYYAYQTADRPQDPQFRLDIYEMMWVLDTKLGYTPEHDWRDEGDYDNHVKHRHPHLWKPKGTIRGVSMEVNEHS